MKSEFVHQAVIWNCHSFAIHCQRGNSPNASVWLLKSLLCLSSSANGTASSHAPSTGVPSSSTSGSSLTSSSSQRKKSDREPPPEKLSQPESSSTTTTVIPRPRPLSLRGRPHAWGLLKGRNKSYSLGHSSGEKSARSVAQGLALAGEMKVGRSLLDVDTEGQKRDCTVPLCRIQVPNRTSVFELEKEFLS